MGGNVIAINKRSGEETPAEHIDLRIIKRSDFKNKSVELFTHINSEFLREYGFLLWADESILLDGSAFNGSTSYIMNQDISDEEVVKYKQLVGDIDLMVPVQYKEELWNLLNSYEGEQILPGIAYVGSNKLTIQSIGSQINSVFVVDFGKEIVPIQVDWEFVEFENNLPTEWASFSHSSSFIDAKLNIKAVHHKFLIRALVGGSSIREDIVICTPKSTPDSLVLSSAKDHLIPRMLKFSVDRGIRVAYEPLLQENGDKIYIDNKQVFKPIPTNESKFVNCIKEIFKLSFQTDTVTDEDIEDFYCFVGVVNLMKRFFTKEQIKETTERYTNLLWGFTHQRGQELERNDPSSDYLIKIAGYKYYINCLDVDDESEYYTSNYYPTYRLS